MSFEPLIPLTPFRACGLALLAGDVALLGGARPHRAASIVAALAASTLLLALWSLASLRLTPRAATAVVAMGALATAGRAAGPGALAVALAVEAVALWHDRRGQPSAFAAGACAAAALAADVTTGLAGLALAAMGVHLARLRDARPADEAGDRRRTAAVTTAVLALPLAFRAPPIFAPEAAPLIALGLVILLCAPWAHAARHSRWRVATAAVLATAAALAQVTDGARSDDIPPGDLAAMEWIRAHAHPLHLVCAPDVAAARWIPAIAARPTTVPVWPGWPAPRGPCGVWLALSGAAPPGLPLAREPAFRTDSAAVWTTSHAR